MTEFWKVAIGSSGLAAIACFVFWSLYRGWFKLDVWVRVTKKQQFILFLVMLVFTFLFAVAGLVTYYFTRDDPSARDRQTRLWNLTELLAVTADRNKKLQGALDQQIETLVAWHDPEAADLARSLKTRVQELYRQRVHALTNGDLVDADRQLNTLREELTRYQATLRMRYDAKKFEELDKDKSLKTAIFKQQLDEIPAWGKVIKEGTEFKSE